MQISIIQPSRNNLKYLKWSYDSIRKNQGSHDVQICVADDFSDDGTWEWCEEIMQTDSNFDAIRNEGPTRLGHTILYDRLVNEVAKYDYCMIFHADMYLAPGALDSLSTYLAKGRVVSLTRVEPPLHPDGPEKVLKDFGTEPENFNERSFLSWLELEYTPKHNRDTTVGVFAPWAFYKKDFQEIGGHDKLYAPQSKEDCVVGETPILVEINGIKDYITIKELWQRYGQFTKVREDGKRYINVTDTGDEIKVISAHEEGLMKLSKLEAILLSTVPTENLITLRTSWGQVTITKDHSILNNLAEAIKVSDLESSDMIIWKPSIMLKDSFRRNILKEINFNTYINIDGGFSYELPVFTDIDEYGNNKKLIDICEFLGFYVAEGGTHFSTENTSYSISISSNNIDTINHYRNLSTSLFGEDVWGDVIINKKEDCTDVYRVAKSSKQLASFMINLLGRDSGSKFVPKFIFNLPKVYQKSFLFGYLIGDGYLGTSITRQNNQTYFSLDKRLFFKKNVFDIATWKSTSKSVMLTSGIYYLLKKSFSDVNLRINFDNNKQVYNISTCSDYDNIKHTLIPYESVFKTVEVFDLQVKHSATFVAGLGFMGLHNSDIFNRFQLNGIRYIQTWKGLVYHMTCRGSRFNPTLTKVGTASDEWTAQNIKSSRNFIRKWGHYVKHDEFMNPIVPSKYKVYIKLLHCNDLKYIAALEPWCDVLYTDFKDTKKYIEQEQLNTLFNLEERIQPTSQIPNGEGILIIVDCENFGDDEYLVVQELSSILSNNPDLGEYTVGSLIIKVNDLTTYEKELIHINNNN